MNITNDRFLSAIQIQDKFLSDKRTDINRTDSEQTSFKDILNKTSEQTAQGSVKFSKHASDRLATRDIVLDDTQIDRFVRQSDTDEVQTVSRWMREAGDCALAFLKDEA